MSTEADEQRIVHDLSVVMLGKLRANRHKPYWNADCGPTAEEMFRLAMKEMEELRDALNDPEGLQNPAKIVLECADVANILAMIVDIVSKEG